MEVVKWSVELISTAYVPLPSYAEYAFSICGYMLWVVIAEAHILKH